MLFITFDSKGISPHHCESRYIKTINVEPTLIFDYRVLPILEKSDMHKSVREMIIKNGDEARFRTSFLSSEFARKTTLDHILAMPERTLEALHLTPKIGEVTIARLRRAVMDELAELAPAEWYVARQGCGQGRTSVRLDRALVTRVRKFLAVWDYGGRRLPVRGNFLKDYTDTKNAVLAKALAEKSAFLYIPESVPEIVKTEAVFIAEQGISAAKHAYLNHLKRVRGDIYNVPDGSLILMDVHRLQDLLQGHGCYAELTVEQIVAQLRLLRGFSSVMSGLDVIVADLRKHGVRSGFATRSGTLMHHCFGGYLELRSPELAAELWEISDRARADGIPFQLWLEHTLQDILSSVKLA